MEGVLWKGCEGRDWSEREWAKVEIQFFGGVGDLVSSCVPGARREGCRHGRSHVNETGTRTLKGAHRVSWCLSRAGPGFMTGTLSYSSRTNALLSAMVVLVPGVGC